MQLCGTIGDEDLYKEILYFFEDRMAPAVLDLHKGSSSIVPTWLIDLCTELIKLETHEVRNHTSHLCVQWFSSHLCVQWF